MKIKRNEVFKLNTGPYPFRAYYVPCEEAWFKFAEDFDLAVPGFPQSAGHCVVFEPTSGSGDMLCLITITSERDYTSIEVAGIVAHEATHAVKELCEYIGEDKPSDEFIAYTTQSVVVDVLHSMEQFAKAFPA